jgi:hypothetical protein
VGRRVAPPKDPEPPSPTFSPNRELARYVSEENRLRGGRTADAAFIDPPGPDPSRDYLSVNSLEIEKLADIAVYYRNKLQRGRGDVAACCHKVFHYKDAGIKAGVSLSYDEAKRAWRFAGDGNAPEDAFKHRPVRSSKDLQSESHCGVEFVRVMNEHSKGKFARRLGGGKYHLVRDTQRK